MPISCCGDCPDPLYVGGGRRIRIYTESNAGVRTDPTTVAIALTDPSGNVATYTYAAVEITKNTTGDYYYDPSWDEAGEWSIKVTTTGAVADVWKGTIEVLA